MCHEGSGSDYISIITILTPAKHNTRSDQLVHIMNEKPWLASKKSFQTIVVGNVGLCVEGCVDA